MTSKESKCFAFSLGKNWIWVLASIFTIGLIYATYNAYYTDRDTGQIYIEDPKKRKSIPINTISPLYDIPAVIQRTGYDFNPKLVNDYRKFHSYTNSTEKAAVNLGVYTIDICYFSTYGLTQQALNYMNVCLELNKIVSGPDLNNFNVLERFEENLSDPDSLIQTLNQFYYITARFLVENEHRDLGVLMLVGTFTEALYMTIQIIDTYPKDMLPEDIIYQVLSPLVSILVSQKAFLMNCIEELENFEGKGDLELAILDELKHLNDIYNNYPSYKFYPHPKELIADRIFAALSEQIKKIRAEIIS